MTGVKRPHQVRRRPGRWIIAAPTFHTRLMDTQPAVGRHSPLPPLARPRLTACRPTPSQEAMQADSPTQPYNSRPPPPQWGSPEAPHTSGNQGRFDSSAQAPPCPPLPCPAMPCPPSPRLAPRAQYEEPSYPPSGSSSRPHSKPPRVAVSALASDGGSGFDPAQAPPLPASALPASLPFPPLPTSAPPRSPCPLRT